MQIKGAIFDMDGTLVDSLGFWKEIWARFGQRFFGDPDFRVSVELRNRLRTTAMSQTAELLHEEYGCGENAKSVERFLTDTCLTLYRTKAKLKSGCLDFLEALASRGVGICLASASNAEMVSAAIERCDIGRFFSKIFICDSFGKGKESPDVFLAAWKHLGTPMEETWVFEDSAVALATAQKAGFQTVGVFDCHTPDQASVIVSSTEYIAEGETLLRLL